MSRTEIFFRVLAAYLLGCVAVAPVAIMYAGMTDMLFGEMQRDVASFLIRYWPVLVAYPLLSGFCGHPAFKLMGLKV